MATKSLSIRIDEEMLNKLHTVADYEGRSANSQILILIRDCIEQYEEKHGKIELGKKCDLTTRSAFAMISLGHFSKGERIWKNSYPTRSSRRKSSVSSTP